MNEFMKKKLHYFCPLQWDWTEKHDFPGIILSYLTTSTPPWTHPNNPAILFFFAYRECMKPAIKVFSNPLLERFTNTPLSWVVAVFSLVFAYTLYNGLKLPFSTFVPLFILGLLLWTLTEYVIHRFVFHSHVFQTRWPRFYMIIHGIHHDTPLDKNRLLVPLYVSLPLGSLFYFIFLTIFPTYADALFSGFILGYLTYDITHYRIHHFQPVTWVGKQLRAYHFKHHFKDHSKNFGVSSPLWDVVLTSKIKAWRYVNDVTVYQCTLLDGYLFISADMQ